MRLHGIKTKALKFIFLQKMQNFVFRRYLNLATKQLYLYILLTLVQTHITVLKALAKLAKYVL